MKPPISDLFAHIKMLLVEFKVPEVVTVWDTGVVGPADLEHGGQVKEDMEEGAGEIRRDREGGHTLGKRADW